jgi:LPS sulfotransferase NodH
MTKSWSEHVLGEEHDLFPDYGAPGPTIRYAIIGTPRSGTNLLGSLLHKMGYGIPAEYFSDWMIDKMIETRGFQGPFDYYTALFGSRTSEAGVFGCKSVQASELQRIKMVVEPNLIIRMSREDKRAQAESFVRAAKTSTYVALEDSEQVPSVIVSEDEIRQTLERQAQLEQFLETNVGPGHVLISYEYLVSNTDDVLRHLANLMGDELPEDWTHPSPDTLKMGRDENGAVDLSMVVT